MRIASGGAVSSEDVASNRTSVTGWRRSDKASALPLETVTGAQ